MRDEVPFDVARAFAYIARSHSIDLTGTKLFSYEIYESEFHEKVKDWSLFTSEEISLTLEHGAKPVHVLHPRLI
jgi:hypothetical protein